MNPPVLFPLTGRRIWVAGHQGMVGAALVRRLKSEGCEILTVDRAALDLRRQADVESWMAANRPEGIFLAAARVGGILANDTYPAEFLHDNLAIELNVIEAARRHGVAKLLFLGSVCIYPKLAPQPVREETLLTGPLEPTNEWYAIAKIAGVKLAAAYRRQYGCNFISAMPVNLYGPGDNFDPAASHVLPALIRKFDTAKRQKAEAVMIWGSGRPRREFLHVDDCADALVLLMMRHSSEDLINIGSGEDITVLELAERVARAVGFSGAIRTDISKPDGTPARLVSAEKINAMGWRPQINLNRGIADTYRWYLENRERLRGGAPN